MRSNMSVLRRLTAAKFVRSRAVAFSSSCELAAANDSESGGGVRSAAPWLYMSPFTFTGNIIWRFFSCSKSDVYYFIPERHSRIPVPKVEPGLVGSSHGWLASYDHESGDLFLLDPITNQHRALPRPMCGKRVRDVFLLDDGEGGEEEEATAALMTFDSGRNLAFCHPGRSQEWTCFGGGDYESVVYSSRHRRLFCITSALKLEAWDLGTPTPRLDTDWVAHFEIHEKRPDLEKVIYIVCVEGEGEAEAEESGSGELFVVVRHVKPSGVDALVGPTVDFDVYKIVDKKKLMAMKDSLEGMTMFLGNNNPIAMRDSGLAGIQPDSIYFGSDTRAGVDSAEVGIFDYRKRALCRQKTPYHIDYFRRGLWFTPRRIHNAI